MKSGCDGSKKKNKRTVPLPVINAAAVGEGKIRASRTSRWRAFALITLQLLMAAHIIQWSLMGTTVSPIEPSEAMHTLESGAVNAGAIFFALAILATLVFGRFVCGWGCHVVALQDFCGWLLKKAGMKPKPFRSRLLVYVPLIVALYMFVWPTFYRWVVKPPDQPLIPQFSNHLITTEFWATFPPVAVAIPFLFICGFMTVYFLGQKGFCTYACPYGGFFAVADKAAPGKIRVTDACNQCGHCTATCTSNVLVHAEVKQFGMVVDPGCMKCMDCVSVCPNDALYYGFGTPTLAAKGKQKRTFSLTWVEEAFAAAVFAASFFAVWDVYQLVPMLMALGIASVTTFLFLKAVKLARAADVSFYRFALRSGGSIRTAGWFFLGFAGIWIGLNAHSGYVRWHERSGALAFENVRIPDELALARADPREWLAPAERENIAGGKQHFYAARRVALFTNNESLPKLAWLEYLSGNTDEAVSLLGAAAERNRGPAKALSYYYRGAIMNRLGRFEEAMASLDQALGERPDLMAAREEKGESLWQLGRREEAVSVWTETVSRNPALPLANSMLAGAAMTLSRPDAAAWERLADRYTPADPYFHLMLGIRLENLGMNALAEKHFTRAVKLDPGLRRRIGRDR